MKPVEPPLPAEARTQLLEHYVKKYPHNPEGVMAAHIETLMKDGKSRDEAERDLAKQYGINLPRTEVEVKTKHCPECGLVVPLDTKICPKCGKQQYYFSG